MKNPLQALEPTLALWKHKAYRNLLFARSISLIGDSIDVIAFAWLAYDLTGSAAMLGLLYAVNVMPNIILSPFIGPVINYLPSKPIMILGDALRACLVLTVALLYLLNFLLPWHLFAMTIAMSTIEVFVIAAKAAVAQLTLPKEAMLLGNSTSSMVIQIAQLLGFAVAGAIIGVFGIHVAMAIDGLTFLLSAVVLLITRFPKRDRATYSSSHYLSSLKSGYAYIWHDKLLCTIVLLCVAANFLMTPVNALLPVYVKESLNADTSILGILSIAITLGTLLGAALVGPIVGRIRAKQALLIPFFGMGILFCALALKSSAVAIFAFFTVGCLLPFINVLMSTYLMQRTPNDLVAHVGGVIGMVTMVANPLGASIFGQIAQNIAIDQVMAYNGFIILGVTLLFTALKPVRNMPPNLWTVKEESCA